MKFFPSALIAAFTLFLLTPASGSILNLESSITSIKAPFVCEKEEKKEGKGKKDKKEGDEEPDCD